MLCESAAFQRFLMWFFKDCHLWETVYDNSGSVVMYRLGQQEAAKAIWKKLTPTQRCRLIMLEANNGNPD